MPERIIRIRLGAEPKINAPERSDECFVANVLRICNEDNHEFFLKHGGDVLRSEVVLAMDVTCQAVELGRRDREEEDCHHHYVHDFESDHDESDLDEDDEDDGSMEFLTGIRPNLISTIDAILWHGALKARQ